ncbi:hypothetical protein K504DRAFT_465910 [Pleomassaria siparia CBS 279.74]|uniref:Mid2 domain-containing protein n=1 Tax=Pleomassaria siparia CBS 279.74 TaxID=1314801 RepID=A0A6G1KDH0_9PLEO|nr:hypothetical protein K504DRAFT_465910 [Pleomassaria siparia CBS 279.74]
MIGVINPNSTQTLALQLEALKTATLMVVPGDPMPKEESTPSGSSPSPSASSTSQANVDAQHNIKWRLSKEDIIGIVVGIILLIAICAALFYFVGRARSLKQGLRTKDAAVIKTSAGPDHGPDYTGIPGSPYSPNVHHADFGGGNGYHPPGYQDGWTSPGLQTPHLSIAEQHRMSMMSMMSTTPVPEKYNYVGVRPNPSQDMIAEMGGSEPVEMEGTVVSKSPPPPALHH